MGDRYKWNEVVWDEIVNLKKEGLIKKIGVSVYTPQEAIEALREPVIEHIQCPVNIIDWRWYQESFLEAVQKRKDVTYQARSIYLQGLLISSSALWPDCFKKKPLFRNIILQFVARFKRLNSQDLCLAYVRGLSWIDSVVLGVETEHQLKENVELFKKPPLTQAQIQEINETIPHLTEKFLNPSLWRKS